MKKRWIFSTLLAMAFAAALILTAADATTVTYVDHGKMAELMAKGGQVARAADYSVSGNHRDKNGQVEVHDKETDVIYITGGDATFVTGGKMIGGKMTKEGQWLGTDIQGGESHHVVPGDVFVVPAGTPHWFKEVKSVNYFVVKIIKP
jgi:mannose-6-phosphate isomerase-like protein (cupin superfamily)